MITGTEDFTRETKLYPNPVESVLHFEYHPPYAVTIVSTSGMMLKKMNSTTRDLSIDFSSLASGIYILQLTNEKGIHHHRITKK